MNRFQFTIIPVLILVLLSCDKNETEEQTSIYGKWMVTDFMSLESVGYPKKDGLNPIIEFKNDGSYNLNLDINSCSGRFTLLNKSEVSFSAAGCTKMCCDSNFSQKFVEILQQVKRYRVETNKLKLEVPDWGWINLKLYD